MPVDDACVTLRAERPDIIRRLLSSSVVELDPTERCTVLTTLCQHLCTTSTVRDCVDAAFQSWRDAKQELKESQVKLERQKRNEAAVASRLDSTAADVTTAAATTTASDELVSNMCFSLFASLLVMSCGFVNCADNSILTFCWAVK